MDEDRSGTSSPLVLESLALPLTDLDESPKSWPIERFRNAENTHDDAGRGAAPITPWSSRHDALIWSGFDGAPSTTRFEQSSFMRSPPHTTTKKGPPSASSSTSSSSAPPSSHNTSNPDFIATSAALRDLFCWQFSDRPVSIAVHRVGSTMLLDSFHPKFTESSRDVKRSGATLLDGYSIPKLGWNGASHQAAVVDAESRSASPLLTAARDQSTSSVSPASLPSSPIEVPDELSAATAGSASPTKSEVFATASLEEQSRLLGAFSREIEFEKSRKKNWMRQRNAQWLSKLHSRAVEASATLSHRTVRELRTQDLSIVVSSNLVVLHHRDEHNSTMTRSSFWLKDVDRPISPDLAARLFTDNVMAGVTDLALFSHRDGVVQGMERVKTNDIPRLPISNGSFPSLGNQMIADIHANASSVLQFLKSVCSEVDLASFWLFKPRGAKTARLWKLNTTQESDLDEASKDESNYMLAMLCYRVSETLTNTDAARRHELLTQSARLLDDGALNGGPSRFYLRATIHERLVDAALKWNEEQVQESSEAEESARIDRLRSALRHAAYSYELFGREGAASSADAEEAESAATGDTHVVDFMRAQRNAGMLRVLRSEAKVAGALAIALLVGDTAYRPERLEEASEALREVASRPRLHGQDDAVAKTHFMTARGDVFVSFAMYALRFHSKRDNADEDAVRRLEVGATRALCELLLLPALSFDPERFPSSTMGKVKFWLELAVQAFESSGTAENKQQLGFALNELGKMQLNEAAGTGGDGQRPRDFESCRALFRRAGDCYRQAQGWENFASTVCNAAHALRLSSTFATEMETKLDLIERSKLELVELRQFLLTAKATQLGLDHPAVVRVSSDLFKTLVLQGAKQFERLQAQSTSQLVESGSQVLQPWREALKVAPNSAYVATAEYHLGRYYAWLAYSRRFSRSVSTILVDRALETSRNHFEAAIKGLSGEDELRARIELSDVFIVAKQSDRALKVLVEPFREARASIHPNLWGTDYQPAVRRALVARDATYKTKWTEELMLGSVSSRELLEALSKRLFRVGSQA